MRSHSDDRKDSTPARSAAADLRAISSTQFGKYTLVAKLGQGAAAEVYLGLMAGPSNFRKLVVVKRLHAYLLDEPGVRDMFMDEARLAARLNHPNVVQSYEVGDSDGVPFIAMEYLEGQSFDRVLGRCQMTGQRLPARLAVRVVADALEGLHHAHELRDFDGTPLEVVHRDASPHNIFVTYDGSAKILDFGVARSVHHVGQTDMGVVKGKYAYIAPEQALGEEIDRRADVWGMGVVLWEGLAGRRLFKAKTDAETLRRSLEEPVPALSDFEPDLPDQLYRIVHRALERDPNERYGTALEMKDELERFLVSQVPVQRREIHDFMVALFSSALEERRRAVAEVAGSSPSHSGRFPVVSRSSIEQTSSTEAEQSAGRPPWRRKAVPGALLAAVVAVALLALPWLGSSDRSSGDAGPASSPGSERAAPPASGASRAPGTGDVPKSAARREALATPSDAPDSADPAQASARTTEEASSAAPAPDPAPTVPEAAFPSMPQGRDESRRAPHTPSAAPGGERNRAGTQAEVGFLTLDTIPWAEVSVGAHSLGTTPLLRVELPAGTHRLELRNPERGIETTYEVTIRAGETLTRRLGL